MNFMQKSLQSVETNKKFIESISEIKNQNSVLFVIQKCS